MQKRTLLVTILGGFIYLIFSGSSYGPGFDYIGNLTGSTGGSASCSTGSGCHGTTSSSTTSVTISFCDSGTTSTRSDYQPNHRYTVRVSASNSLGRSHYGFQGSSTTSSGAQAGYFIHTATGTDTVRNSYTGYRQMIEHHPSTLSGSSGSFSVNFDWKAPGAGKGDVTFYVMVNAVNNNGSADTGDKWNNASPLTISEMTATQLLQPANNSYVEVYPNPVTTQVMLHVQNATNGVYNIDVFDHTGRKISSYQVNLVNANGSLHLETAGWLPGVYCIMVEKGDERHLVRVVKQ